jgi:UDPglucose 6-dehydrogenase
MSARIGVVGLSHLGIVAGACLASMGEPVVAVDADAGLVAAMRAGRPPIHEPGLDDLLAGPRPAFTTDYAALAECSLVVVAVDTVTDDAHRSDLGGLEAHLDRALPWLPADGVVALMSQVPVGYTRDLVERLRHRRPALRARVVHWVETLVIGDAVARYLRPERIIVGVEDPAGAPEAGLDALLARFGCPVFRMSYESAELTKAAINLYLGLAVTYANALADLCEATGASMRDMIPALRADRRIGPHAYIRPGLGIAGGNLERDLVHLARTAEKHALDPGLYRLVLDRSAGRYGWLLRAIDRHVRPGAPLAVWGLAYKKDTASTKNSVALRLLGDLRGRSPVSLYDPRAVLPAPMEGVRPAATAEAALAGADALVILTDWDEFAACDPAALARALRGRVVIDAVGVLDGRRVRAAGLAYVAVGEAA